MNTTHNGTLDAWTKENEPMNELHPAYNKAEIAQLYYQETHPERNYSREAARKQFLQDRGIDYRILKDILKRILSEQLKAL